MSDNAAESRREGRDHSLDIRSGIQAEILNAFRNHALPSGLMTAREILVVVNTSRIFAGKQQLELYVLRPRLTELRKAGLLETCGRMIDFITGIRVSIWKLRT